MGIISVYYAKKNFKNPYLWFFLGVLFGVWSLVALFFINHKKKETTPQKKNDPFLKSDKLWYYLTDDKEQVGPMSLTKLNSLYRTGKIHDNSYIWNEDLENWQKLILTAPFSQEKEASKI